MRPEIKEMLQDKLESFVTEYLNDSAKNADRGCCGVYITNPEMGYYKGYIDGMCCAFLPINSYIVISSQEYGDESHRLWRQVYDRPTDRQSGC